MQDSSGLKRIFSIGLIYELFQKLVGASYSRQWMLDDCWHLDKVKKIVDIGCGPGTILDVIPNDIEYIGIDVSKEYIEAAQKSYKDRNATFILDTASNLLETSDERLMDTDLIMCNGLLHHLEDEEAGNVLKLAKQIMKPNGRLICLEPTYLVHQGILAKWIMSKDRGCNVRIEKDWKKLVSSEFEHYNTNIATGLIRIPYSHIIIECRKCDFV